MKQKLKLLFAFLRGLKGHLVDTSIVFAGTYIEDWNMFDVTNEQRHTKRMQLPLNFEKFIEELIKNHMDDFYEFLNLDFDEYLLILLNLLKYEKHLLV